MESASQQIARLTRERDELLDAGNELAEAIDFIAFDDEGVWYAGPTPEGREQLLKRWQDVAGSAWRRVA